MKKGRLGPAFHDYLEYLESIEAVLHATPEQAVKMKLPQIASDVKNFDHDGRVPMDKILAEQYLVDAYLAGVVRSSGKFVIDFETLHDIREKYMDEIEFLSRNCPVRLPFEWTTLIIRHPVEDFVIVAQEQEAPEGGYPEMSLDEGDKFVCLNMVGYVKQGTKDENNVRRKDQKLSHFPLELHLPYNLPSDQTHAIPAPIDGMIVMPQGRQLCEALMSMFVTFIYTFELTSVLRLKSTGVAPTPGKHVRRFKKRKKANHPMFEHSVVKLEIDAPEPGQSGMSMLQSKKRLHAVRGFWRTYSKTGKRVWVKAHWRGDEKLGVIRRDVELVTHEEEAEV